MSLFNKLTIFSILILLTAFVAVPVMANTMSATWDIDLDDTTAGNQSGWTVTLTYVTAPATLPTDASITPVVGATVEDFKPTVDTIPAAVAGTTKVFTFKVQLTNVSTAADITLTGHRRVTLTNSADLTETSIYTPKLKSITAPKSARAGTFDATIEFEPQADFVAATTTPVAAAIPGIGPATGLKVGDIAVTSGSVLSVMDNGNMTYTIEAVLTDADVVITLAETFPHQDAPDGDDSGTDADAENQATVIYDNGLPVIGPIVFKSLTNRDLDTSSVTGAFDVYVDHIVEEVGGTVPEEKSIIDTPATVSDEDDYPLVVEFTVEPAARGATVSNEGRIDGKPAATITPKENTTSTNWPATTLTVLVKVTDAAGNFAVKRALFTVAPRAAADTGPVDPTGDTMKPTVVSIVAPAAPIAAGQPNAGSLVFTITFSEALKDGTFTLNDLVITNVDTQTAHSTLVKDTTDPKIYKLTVTPKDKTFPVKVSFHADATVMDLADNESVAGIVNAITYTPKGVLGVEIKPPDKPLNGSLVFTFEFAQAPLPATTTDPNNNIIEDDRGFTISDVDASNAMPLVASNLRKSVSDDKVYYLTVKPMNPRLPVTVTLHADAVVADATPADTANDDALVAGQVSATFTPDITAPTLAITHTPADSAAVASGEMVTFTFTFTDENTIETSGAGAFTTNDVAVVGGTKGTFTATNNKTYTLMVTPTTPNTDVTVTVAAGSVTDTAVPPNAIAASVSETWTAPTIADTAAPTLAITHTPADNVAVAAGGMVTFTFTFTDQNMIAASGAGAFTADDVAVVGGTKGTFTATNNKTYTLTVTPTTPNTNVTVTVAAGSVTDTATTPNAIAASVSETWTAPPAVDRTPPTLTITHSPADGMALPASGNVTFTFTFNEALGANDAAFTFGDVTIAGGSPVEFAGSGMVYTLEVKPTNAMTSVTVTVAASEVADAAGNNLAADATQTYMPVDDVPPTVVITSAMGTGTNAGKIVFTFTFSELLKAGSFTEADIIRGPGVTLAGVPVMDTTNNKVYTLLVTPPTSGSTTLTLRTGSVEDMAGNALVGDQSHTYVAPNPAPTKIGAISARTLTAGDAAVAMDVSSYFSDTDALTYTASSSDDTKATVSVSGSMVSITPVAAGNATITVTATDTAGGKAMQTITVTVVAPNPAPTKIGAISARTLTVGGTPTTINVESAFSDPGDTLTYSAVSSDITKATVSVSGSMVSITPVAAGNATITVTATDTASQTAMQTIAVTVNARHIPTPPTVDISLVANSLDIAANTFRVKFTFAKVGIDGVDVPPTFTANNVKVTSDAAGEILAGVTVPVGGIQGLLGGRSWVVTIDYELADLPLYVGSTGITVSTATVNDQPSASGLLMVSAPNNAPVFTEGATATRSIAENTTAGMNIGAAITATDADSDTLTYTLSGTDFAIDSATGQLKTSAALDYETKTSYTVTVTAADGNGGTDTITVTINVTNDPSDDPSGPDRIAPTLTITHSPADMAALPASGNVTFTFTFNEALGANDAAFTFGDVTIAGGSPVEFAGSGMVYTLEVKPTNAMTSVTVTVAASAVADAAGNNLAADATETYTADDTVAPTVTITSAMGTGSDAGKIVFTFTFSEPITGFTADDLTRGTGVTLAGNPVKDSTNDKVYTVLVNPSTSGDTILTLKTGSVMDLQGNPLVGDQAHTYVAPDAPGPGPATDPTTPANGFNFTVPAKSHVILVRSKSAALSNAPPIGQGFKTITDIDGNRVIPDANIREWRMMPDLAELFDRGAIGGGGALILRKVAGDTAAPAVGTVGISEIMWAIDVGYIRHLRARDSQWIEIHNLNTTAKQVRIYAQTGDEFTDTNRVVTDTQAGDRIYGKLGDANETKMVVDVITNYFNGSNRGTAGWDVPGSNGSSKTGINFVSMARIPKRGSFNLTRRHENKNDKPLDGLYNNAKGAENSLDGRASGSWAASTVRYEQRNTADPDSATTHVPVVYNFVGTPGRPNTHTVTTHITTDTRTNVPSNTVIINEVANRSDNNQQYEWIELRNVSTSEINLRNYLISMVLAVDKDDVLYQFPANDNAKLAPGEVILLVDTDPRDDPDHPLAVGYNVDLSDEDQVSGALELVMNKDIAKYKVTDFAGNGLPDHGKFVLVLRRPDNHEGQRSGADGGKGVAERGKDDLDKIVDIAGWNPDLAKANYSNAVSSTNLWPLRSFRKADFTLNKFEPEKVHFRQRGAHGLGGVNDGASGAGAHENKNEGGKAAFRDEAYTGIGYKRQAKDQPAHGGTPGYHNTIKGKVVDLTAADNAKVVISEIMLSQGTRGNLPQWIELYNPSKTYTINLEDNAGWRLVIENAERAPIITINFKTDGNVKKILPNQTVLIVSSSARDYGSDNLQRGTVFPNTRVLNAYAAIRGETFELASRTSPLLSPEGFNIRLLDGTTANNKPDGRYTGVVSDEIGNLDGNPRTTDAPAWTFPAGMTEDGKRTSLIRNFVKGVAQDGTMAENWVRAVDTGGFAQLFVRHTWYGDETDYGTPADRTGSVLPVRLSHFRPTLEDGKVVIRWTTESELDNAGFNILRSDTRNGEFKQVNDKLIAGKGTTGERSTYTWVDATAKPSVVYYYQIEDVSFAGERQTLRTTKLKGYISAENKLTTTWGDLKEVQ